jgi:hypothetical protein
MASSTPPRKFAPAPIEQTTKSSRHPAAPKDEEKKPRRFAPEPIEETIKSSKDARQPNEQAEKPKPRRFAPEPVEQTVKSSKDTNQKPSEQNEKPKPRRFAPEPVETTTKSSKDIHHQSDVPKARRFAPQVVEETHKSSKDKEAHDKKGHVKFTPELVSTTHTKKRNAKKMDDVGDDDVEEKPPRKFAPIFLETATRSRKAGDPNAPLSQSDRTEYAYHLHAKEHWKRVTGVPSGPSSAADPEPVPADAMDIDDEVYESRRSSESEANDPSQAKREVSIDGSAPTKRPSCLIPKRQRSFRTPELDTIDSSESEPDSNPSPLSSSPGLDGSPIAVPDYEFLHATRIRESVDENFTHYLLEVERKKQQQRLEEQALAAFPNADFGYEPPDHYINNDDDSEDMEIEDRPVTFDLSEDEMPDLPRRDSNTRDMSWEQQEAQRHAELAQQERNANKVANKPTQSPFWKPPKFDDDQDPEVKAMRDRARPPMLGADLVFPRCPSPEPARFDVTQGSTALRNQMCYLTEAAEAERKRTGEDEGLWQVKADNKRISTVKSGVMAAPKKSTHKGLWGGFCAVDENSTTKTGGLVPPSGPTGLQTPRNEKADPIELAFTEGVAKLKTPEMRPAGLNDADLNHLDAVLVTENDMDSMMDNEFPDSFITQVYNYLSLGYPSLAKPFDGELSKISRIPISQLRQDDRKARLAPRGYIRLGSDFEGGGGEGMTEDSCMRWRALKLYVREWARQEKNMVKTDMAGGNWGTSARRGSWAI